MLSLTTLSTPHDGSMLADLSVQRHEVAARVVRSEFPGFPNLIWLIDYLAGSDIGRFGLQTTDCSVFNAGNVPKLPRDVIYNTIAADADQDGDAEIDWWSPDESLEMRQEESSLNRPVADDMYQMLRNYSTVTYTASATACYEGNVISVATFSGVSIGAVGNDIMVAVPSALGRGCLAPPSGPSLVRNTRVFTGQETPQSRGRNHASVADDGVGRLVSWWILDAEAVNGDLR